jgi:hypothetical protein
MKIKGRIQQRTIEATQFRKRLKKTEATKLRNNGVGSSGTGEG